MTRKRKSPPPKKPSPVVRKPRIHWAGIAILAVIGASVAIPFSRHWACKAQCLKSHQGPYPEIACKYACPVPFAEYFRFKPDTAIDK